MKIKTMLLSSILFFGLFGIVSAAPWKPAPEKHNVVSYYEEGTHTIPGEEESEHTGKDLVMQAGKSGVHQQWFYGESEDEGMHGEHSVWNPAGPNGCPNKWELIEDAYENGWGDHFEPGADYCVKTNDFGPFK